jgi:hypothetical protein
MCANCGHRLAHHGHYSYTHESGGRWIDERRCWVWVPTGPRSGRGCRCEGWKP